MRRSLPVSSLTVLLLAVALPTGAQAGTKVMDAGLPWSSHKRFWANGGTANAFFPSRLTIRVGDAVRFRPSGYHSIQVRARGARAGRLVAPFIASSTRKVQGAADAAGSPFWFEGQPVIVNAAALKPRNWGKRFTFTGKRSIRSGYLLGPRKAMVVRFKKAGTFTVVDEYHRGMKATVRVLPASRRAPSAKADDARVRKQIARAFGVLTTLKRTVPAPGTIGMGAAGDGGVEYYDFFPKLISVAVGATVTFRIAAKSLETHVVATGPGDTELEPQSTLGVMARTFEHEIIDPAAYYGSEPAGTVADLSPTIHGNGFWSSGAMDNDAATTRPSAVSVRFTQPGTYVFSCLIHKYEHTTVIVG